MSSTKNIYSEYRGLIAGDPEFIIDTTNKNGFISEDSLYEKRINTSTFSDAYKAAVLNLIREYDLNAGYLPSIKKPNQEEYLGPALPSHLDTYLDFRNSSYAKNTTIIKSYKYEPSLKANKSTKEERDDLALTEAAKIYPYIGGKYRQLSVEVTSDDQSSKFKGLLDSIKRQDKDNTYIGYVTLVAIQNRVRSYAISPLRPKINNFRNPNSNIIISDYEKNISATFKDSQFFEHLQAEITEALQIKESQLFGNNVLAPVLWRAVILLNKPQDEYLRAKLGSNFQIEREALLGILVRGNYATAINKLEELIAEYGDDMIPLSIIKELNINPSLLKQSLNGQKTANAKNKLIQAQILAAARAKAEEENRIAAEILKDQYLNATLKSKNGLITVKINSIANEGGNPVVYASIKGIDIPNINGGIRSDQARRINPTDIYKLIEDNNLTIS